MWSKLRDNLRAKTNIVVTQDSSTKRQVAIDEKETTGQRKGTLGKTTRKTAVVKPTTKREDSPVKKISLSGIIVERTLKFPQVFPRLCIDL